MFALIHGVHASTFIFVAFDRFVSSNLEQGRLGKSFHGCREKTFTDVDVAIDHSFSSCPRS